MAHCPAYSGAICSLCCSLETRCRDCCKPQARVSNQLLAWFGEALPERIVTLLNTHVGRYLGVLSLFVGVIGAVLSLVYFLIALDMEGPREVLISTLWTVFFILIIIAGVAALLFVVAQESRRVAEEETSRQTDLLMNEIEAHKRTDAKLQKAKEVAEAASTAKSRHVVGLSHELRTPLNAILGYAQLLERDPAIPKPRLNAIRVVRRSAEHLSGLIDGLLDISKIAAGRFHLSRTEVQLSAFLDEIVAMFRLQATAKGIEFRHVRTGRLPVVIQTDENRLRQILINLLSNAIKFTDAGHVTFRVRYHHQVAEFTVEDTGVGIHSSDLERIFQPFERARTVGALATIGTGLGLTITSLLTKIMGGDISVESEVGKGSTFRVKLLLSEVTRPRIASTMEYRVRGYGGPRQTVLVVDDNEVQRELIRDLLEPLGFVVVSAASGRECLQIVEQTNPNLLFARHCDAGNGRLGSGAATAPPSRQTSGNTHSFGECDRSPPHARSRAALRRYADEADRPSATAQKDSCAGRYRMALYQRSARSRRVADRAADDRQTAGRLRYRRTHSARRNRARYAHPPAAERDRERRARVQRIHRPDALHRQRFRFPAIRRGAAGGS